MSDSWNLYDNQVDAKPETHKSLFAYVSSLQPGDLLRVEMCSPQAYHTYQKANQGSLPPATIIKIYGSWTAAWKDFSIGIFKGWQDHGILTQIEAKAYSFGILALAEAVERAKTETKAPTPETP